MEKIQVVGNGTPVDGPCFADLKDPCLPDPQADNRPQMLADIQLLPVEAHRIHPLSQHTASILPAYVLPWLQVPVYLC